MTNKEAIEVFFSREVEKMYDGYILDDKNYIVPQDALDNYIKTVLSVPYCEFIDHLRDHYSEFKISSKNVTQCSSFSACEEEMCITLMKEHNPGLTFLEIGRLFPDYVSSKADPAYIKFGENQIKTAAQLGLAFEYFDVWFLSCLGYVYSGLSDETKKSLLARTLLRDPLYGKIMVDLCNSDIYLLSYMGTVKSAQTKSRRYRNVEKLLSICTDECKREGIQIGRVLDSKTNILEIEPHEESTIIAGKTVLLEYAADLYLFQNGFTIPSEQHPLWQKYFDIPNNTWTGDKPINVIIDKKPFKATLKCSTNLLRQKQRMQIVYSDDSPIVQYLRDVLHVSYNYIKQAAKQTWFNDHKNVQIPEDQKEFITVYAANRNDTIYITTKSIDKKERISESANTHQGVKDLEYYLGCFRDISISSDGRKIIAGKLSMLLSLVEYIKWLKSFNEDLTPELPILGVWEGMYLKIFQQYYDARRTSTLFSSPFILLNEEPYWKLVNEEDIAETPTSGKYAMMTFVNVQATFKSVIIDKELFDLIMTPESCSALSDYLLKLLKKYNK